MRLGDALIVLGGGLEKASDRAFKKEEDSARETAEQARQENMARLQHQLSGERDEKNFGREKQLIDIRQKGDVELEGMRNANSLEREKHADARAAGRDRVAADRADKTNERQTNNIVLTDIQKRREQSETALRSLQQEQQRIQAASAKKDILGNEMDPTTGMTWGDALKMNQQRLAERQQEIDRLNAAFDFEYARSQGKGADAPPVRSGSGGGPQKGRVYRPTKAQTSQASIPPLLRR